VKGCIDERLAVVVTRLQRQAISTELGRRRLVLLLLLLLLPFEAGVCHLPRACCPKDREDLTWRR
jgi:hypothetical protein